MQIYVPNPIKFEGADYVMGTQTVVDSLGLRMVNAGVAVRETSRFVKASRVAAFKDINEILECDSPSDIDLIIPTQSDMTVPVDSVITLYRNGSGRVNFVAAPGVSIQNSGQEIPQYGTGAIRYRDNNVWVMLLQNSSSTPASLVIAEDAIPVLSLVSTLNFTGAGVNVTNAGAGVVNIEVPSLPGGGSGALYAVDMAALRALAKPTTNGTQAVLKYHTAEIYGGGGYFIWDAASSAADDNGCIIATNAGGVGRWKRLILDRTALSVNDFGAKNSNNSADSAINLTAILAAAVFMNIEASSRGNVGYVPPIQFQAGAYYTNPIEMTFIYAYFVGKGSGITRLIAANGFSKPLIYVTGASRLNAYPYGGFKGITFAAGNQTYPAIIYAEGAIDNQFTFSDIGFKGSTLTKPVDALSIGNYLNMTVTNLRTDGISGYGLRVRFSSESMTAASNAGSVPSDQRYAINAFDSTTGLITFPAGQDPTEVPNGSAVLLFTTGVLPTRTSTGLALSEAKDGKAYFINFGKFNAVTLHDTEAEARTGTNPILLDVATGSGTHRMAVCQAVFPVTGVAGTNVTFTNDKNVIIATTANATDSAVTLGTGSTNPIASAASLHQVIPVSTGTLDSALTAGRFYYPIYVDANTIKLADTPALAIAGTAINLNGDGTGTMYLLYNHGLSILGVSGLAVRNLTYDNAGCATINTINGVAVGGLGILYADFRYAAQKGSISYEGHRVEINKQPSPDLIKTNGAVATLFRVETGKLIPALSSIQISIKNLPIEGFFGMKSGAVKLLGNSGVVDIAPSVDRTLMKFVSGIYNNDRGTARSKTRPTSGGAIVSSYEGFNNTSSMLGRLDSSYNAVGGAQSTPFSIGQATSSSFKAGDLVSSMDSGVAYYQCTNAYDGFSKGTGTTNALGGALTVSATAGNSKFVMSGIATEPSFGDGAAISIAGAGAAGATITGVVTNYNDIGASDFTFSVNDANGDIIKCGTTISGVQPTFPAVKLGKVPVLYSNSAALDFASIAALASADLTIAAPAGVTLTAGKVVRLGLPSNVPSGVVYTAFVTAGGGSVTVRATNITAGSIDPASGTFSYEVSA